MNKKRLALLLALLLACAMMLAGCQNSGNTQNTVSEAPAAAAPAASESAEPFAAVENDKDFSALRTPGSQEEAYDYELFFLPEKDGTSQPYVGDPMPYYENGTFYLYYLKEAGDSYNHSVYLAKTKDFLNYEEVDAPVLEASRSGGQDGWIGTGSVVKVEDKY